MEAQAVRLCIPADEWVLRWQLQAPCRRRSADGAQVLQQIPETGDSVPLGGRHQLSWRRWGWRWVPTARGAVSCLAGQLQARGKVAAPAIHGRQRRQADGVPHTGMHTGRVAHKPKLLPGQLLAGKLSCQGRPHSSGQGAVPEVVAAARVWVRAAAGAGLWAAAAHARRQGEAVEHQAPVHLLVLVLPRQLPQARQQACDLAAVGCSRSARGCQGLKGSKALQALLLHACLLQLQLRAVAHPEVRQGDGGATQLPAQGVEQDSKGVSLSHAPAWLSRAVAQVDPLTD